MQPAAEQSGELGMPSGEGVGFIPLERYQDPSMAQSQDESEVEGFRPFTPWVFIPNAAQACLEL